MKKVIIKGSIMRIQSVTPANFKKHFINNTKSILQNNADNISQPLSDKKKKKKKGEKKKK